jgi:transposase
MNAYACIYQKGGLPMNYRDYNPDQIQLFGYRPEDVLEEDHLVYLVDEMVENLDLKRFYDLTPGAGNPAYDPRLMLKILFFGYAIGVFSSRKLQQQCRENLAFIHLTRGQRPKFRAICEFRVRHQENIKGLFPQMLQIAQRLNILRIGRLILDSTKIKANAGAHRVIKADKYEDILNSIDDYLKHAQTQDLKEDQLYGEESTGQELPKELHSKSQRAQKLKEIIQQARRGNLKYINTTDPEAKFIKDTATNKIKPSYNVQVALEADSGLIVTSQTTNTPDDHEHLVPLVKKAEENTGVKPEKVDADSGYYSNASVGALEKEHIDTCIPDTNTASYIHRGKEVKSDKSSTRYTQDKFQYCPEEDVYICPQQKKLIYRGKNKLTHKTVKEYSCIKTCSSCPEKAKCLTHPQAKHHTLAIDPEHKTLLLVQEKFKKEQYRQRYKQRASLIERVFGHFKKNLKFTQFLLRGKAKAHVEITLLCIGFNLLVMKHWVITKAIEDLFTV